jgi:hypothetical protein
MDLTRVELWTTDATTDIDVYIYDDFNGSTLSNLLASRLNISYNEAGYHSVTLDSPIEIAAVDDIYVAVKFTNSSYTYPVAADEQGPNETGTTYISSNGSSWYDLGTNQASDVAIGVRSSGLPTLTLTSPNGGEDWEVGSSQTISWTSAGLIPNVKIEYSTNGGTDWRIIVSSTPDDGSHPWTVPVTPSTNCLVKVSDASDGEPLDVSDAPFTLSDQTPPSKVTNLEATPTDTSIVLTWSPAMDNIGVNNYLIYRDTTGGFIPSDSIAAPPDTAYVDLEADPGETYYYKVSAVDSAGNESEYSDEVQSTIPSEIKSERLLKFPGKFLLMRNYPDPFNQVTEIKYILPKDTQVKLEVYNLLGQKVATLVDQRQTPGNKAIIWDAGSLSSGVYIYRLCAGVYKQTKKMVLLR